MRVQTELKEFLTKFIETRGDNIIDPKCGLCCNAALSSAATANECCDFIGDNCKDWEHFSGSVLFPILGMEPYYKAKETRELYTGKQLDLRISLAKHLIAKIGAVIELQSRIT